MMGTLTLAPIHVVVPTCMVPICTYLQALSLAVRSDVIPVQFVPLSAYIVG